MNALYAEFTKLFATRLWAWMCLVVIALTAGLAGLIFGLAEEADFITAEDVSDIVTFVAPIGYVVAMVIGIVGITGEYRHQTITPTLLATPIRPLVIFSKLVTYAVYGALMGVLFVLSFVGLASPILSSKDFDISFGEDPIRATLAGTVLVCVLFGAFGVGIGTLLRNQILSSVFTIVYLFVVDNILLVIPHVKTAYPYLPGGLARAVINGDVFGGDDPDPLHTGPAALLLTAWGIGLALVGWIVTTSRDVT